MTRTPQKNVQMNINFEYRAIHRCKVQIYSQISLIDNIFVDIWCPVFNYLINSSKTTVTNLGSKMTRMKFIANLGSTYTPIVPPTLTIWGPRGPQVGKMRGTIGVHVDPRLAKFGEQLGYTRIPVCQWTFFTFSCHR